MDKGREKESVIKNFSRYALLYDGNNDIQNKAALDLAGILPSGRLENILEIGCGTGNYTAMLRKKYGDCRIKAVDISGEMIDVARSKAQSAGTDFIIGDAELLDFAGSFDLVTSNAVFHWLDDLPAFIEKAAILLSPSGTLAFSSFGPGTFGELKESLAAASGRKIAVSSDYFPVRRGIERQLEKHFDMIRITEKAYKEWYPSLTSLLKKIKYSGTRGRGTGKVWSPDLVRKIEHNYIARFGAIEATYQVFLCEAWQ